MRKRVLFPHPLGPSSARKSPGVMVSEIGSTAVIFLSKTLDTALRETPKPLVEEDVMCSVTIKETAVVWLGVCPLRDAVAHLSNQVLLALRQNQKRGHIQGTAAHATHVANIRTHRQVAKSRWNHFAGASALYVGVFCERSTRPTTQNTQALRCMRANRVKHTPSRTTYLF